MLVLIAYRLHRRLKGRLRMLRLRVLDFDYFNIVVLHHII